MPLNSSNLLAVFKSGVGTFFWYNLSCGCSIDSYHKSGFVGVWERMGLVG